MSRGLRTRMCRRVRVSVVCECNVAGQNLCDEVRILFRICANHPKKVAFAPNVQQIQHSKSMGGRRSVIDRETELAFGGMEAREDRAPPWQFGTRARRA